MEPNKFEQIAKEKLAKREVKPSDRITSYNVCYTKLLRL